LCYFIFPSYLQASPTALRDVHYVFEATQGLQFFTLPFSGVWRLYACGGYGGNFAMQEGGHPAQVKVHSRH